MKATVRYRTLKLDIKGFTDDLIKETEKVFREGAAEFAKAASKRVPVRTGMARGAFLAHVQRFTGARGTSQTYLGLRDSPDSININPLVSRWHKRFKKKPRVDGKIKNKKLGADQSLYVFSNDGKRMKFEFMTEVLQYRIYDSSVPAKYKPQSGYQIPWHSLKIGKKVFIEYVREHIRKRLPNVNDYIMVR